MLKGSRRGIDSSKIVAIPIVNDISSRNSIVHVHVHVVGEPHQGSRGIGNKIWRLVVSAYMINY